MSGVQVIDGAHYGDEVTLTATVSGAEGTNALPHRHGAVLVQDAPLSGSGSASP